MKIHTSNLQHFVDQVNEHSGDVYVAELASYRTLELQYDTEVDPSLDPFSEAYFVQQMELYREVAGRELDQKSGELHSVDVDALVNASNPLGSGLVSSMSENIRTLSTMVSLSCLPQNAEVLDLGAGHGLSSEVFGLSGCRVHAIDIDPAPGELSLRRAAQRGYLLQRSVLNFDDVNVLEDDRYDAAYFFQSLHHCLKPWDLIESLARKLKPDGVIAFAGEPIQTLWWPHWGLRLDAESLYVARHLGWFESGFSHDFIRSCFERCGLKLLFLSGGFMGQEIGIATKSDASHQNILNRATILGLTDMSRAPVPSNNGFLSTDIGKDDVVDGQKGFSQRGTWRMFALWALSRS